MNRNMTRRLSGRVGYWGIDAPGDGLDDKNCEVSDRIAAMGFMELRGLSQDYRDMCKRKGFVPCSFRQWLRDRVADQLIANQYDDERSWF